MPWGALHPCLACGALRYEPDDGPHCWLLVGDSGALVEHAAVPCIKRRRRRPDADE